MGDRERPPSSQRGRDIQSLNAYLASGTGPWRRLSAHGEPATHPIYLGGTSIEEVFVNLETGQMLVRYSIVRDGEVLHLTYRDEPMFGT